MIDRLYETRERMALDFLRQIAPSGTVYIPTDDYLADGLGWTVQDAGEAIGRLVGSGMIERLKLGVYRLL